MPDDGARDPGTAAEAQTTPAGSAQPPETPELRRLRRRIDALDRRIVASLNARAELVRDIGRAKAAAGWRGVRDREREREVLLRVTMANDGPMPQADLIAVYRRLIAAARSIETQDRARGRARRMGEEDGGDG